MFLKYHFSGVYFVQKIWHPVISRIFGPPKSLHFRWKIKNVTKLMFGLSIGFQNGMSWPHSNKTHKLVRVLGNGPFLDKGPGVVGHGAGSLTQQYNSYAEQNLKFSVYFMQQIKSYAIFTFRQTHRRTFCTLYTWARFFLYGNLYLSLHYVPLLASLTHSLHLWRMIFSIKTILKNCLLLL